MIKSTKAFLLAGASALAILASTAAANAETFMFTNAEQFFTASMTGVYAVEVLGASGGNATSPLPVVLGGLGAEVSGDISLTAGETLTLFVGGQGVSGAFAGGGGGGSFLFGPTGVLAVAGGGGGGGNLLLIGDGGPGLAGKSGGTEGRTGSGSGKGGMDGTGGGGGSGYSGGGGAGVKAGPSGYGGDSQSGGGFGGTPPLSGGGGGAAGANGGMGGFGGGGGAGGFGGGGGSGYSGGGGGGSAGGYGGGGGGSFLALQFIDPVLTTGGASRGDGSISVDLLPPAVPEPSTWAMMLMGFAGLGWLAHTRGRKTSPA
jgi:PEP-CTERM motif